MPAYSFKERFVPWVKDGSKPGTIRAFRKHPVKVGDIAHLYYGMRTRYCTKLVDPSPVIREVRTVIFASWGSPFVLKTNWIEPQYRDFFLNDRNLIKFLDQRREKGKPDFLRQLEWRQMTNQNERDRFAWLDGFRHANDPTTTEGCYEIMYRYWKQTSGLPFLGNHIFWGNRVCRECRCTEHDACVHTEYGNCWWIESDLCSHCKNWPGQSKRFSQL